MDKTIHKELQYISLGKFFEILEYKAKERSCKIIKVNPYNTSKTCSRCGWINNDLKLSDRVFKCTKCGLRLDRDVNASINILLLGKKEYNGREMGEVSTSFYTPPLRVGTLSALA